MAVADAFRRVPKTLLRAPVIVLLYAVFGVLQSLQALVQQFDQTAGLVVIGISVALYVFAYPFFYGGIIQMVDEALVGETSLSTLFQAGRANYVSLLGASLALYGMILLFGVIAGALFYFGTLAFSAVNGAIAMLMAVPFVLAFGVALLVFTIFLMFYAQEIVLNDASALGGLKQSASLVRSNLVSSVVFFVVTGLVLLFIGFPFDMFAQFLLPTVTGTAGVGVGASLRIIGYLVFSVTGTTLSSSVITVFFVAFYREIRGRSRPEIPNTTA